MRAWTLATLGGAIIVYGIDWVPPPGQIIAMAGAGLVMLALALWRRYRHPEEADVAKSLGLASRVASGLLVGLAWAGGNADIRLSEALPAALEQTPIRVSGYPCSVPAWGAWSSVQQDFCVTSIAESDTPNAAAQLLPVPSRLKLARYNADARFTLSGPATVEVFLKRPHGNVNPDGFRYETWLYRQGYLATGSLRAILSTRDPGAADMAVVACSWQCRYHSWRQQLVQALNEAAAGMRHLALVESLFLGSRGQLQPDDWEVLRNTGTSHLVAISGLHVGLIAAMAGFIARGLLLRAVADRYGPSLVPLATYLFVCLAALCYALMAGFTVPTQRALVMVAVGGMVWLRGSLRRAWDGWLLAAFIVLVLDPFAVLDMGFWLSFGAVACLILVFGGRLGTSPPWRSLLIAQLAITLGLWPLLSVIGVPTAPLGFAANLFAIPWLSFVVMPILVVAVPLILLGGLPSLWASYLLDSVLAVLWRVLEFIASLGEDWAESVPSLPLPMVVLLFITGFLALLPVANLYRLLAVSLSATLLIKFSTATAVNLSVPDPQITVLDVGQGLAVLVRDGEQALLYDTGPAGGGFSAAESQILPSAKALGVARLDLLILSHADGDHAGAWQRIADRLSAAEVVSGEPEELSATVLPCRFADGQTIGRWQLRAWQAPLTLADSGNGRSCVIEAVYGTRRVALTGDIGLKQEQAWLAAREMGPVDVLLAPHHGSKSSSSDALAAELRPAFTIFSAGYRNRYGHPHPDVLTRYRRQGSELLSIPDTGALTFTFFPDRIDYIAERDRAPFWIRPRSFLGEDSQREPIEQAAAGRL